MLKDNYSFQHEASEDLQTYGDVVQYCYTYGLQYDLIVSISREVSNQCGTSSTDYGVATS